jgi:hypothetical protein
MRERLGCRTERLASYSGPLPGLTQAGLPLSAAAAPPVPAGGADEVSKGLGWVQHCSQGGWAACLSSNRVLLHHWQGRSAGLQVAGLQVWSPARIDASKNAPF